MTNCTAELIAGDHDCPDCDPNTTDTGTGRVHVLGEPPTGQGRWRTTPRHIATVTAGLLATVVVAALACHPTNPGPVPSPAPGPTITTILPSVPAEGAGGGVSGGAP